ncbi:substrate-binding domain-containing protein [Pelagicoccus albus]|uniref:Substrate-binding domain-containing protein n=1 Tax=Pelagicoccus albus TaxID=415222 RepID=A0A7X1B831_9BACT|nr:substrate-binding domain-containing protein [Pelagicoccus albus]MBC2607424.1 substrate-binding domain-containing protein [Pelagicoccus albus]
MDQANFWINVNSPRRRVLLALYWWEDRVFEGVAKFAAEQSWILDCKMRWTHAIPSLAEWKGDGIIANPGFSSPIKPLIQLIESSQAPTVGLQTFGDYPFSSKVLQDHNLIGSLGAKHLASLNFKQVAFVSFADNPVEQARCKAFCQQAEKSGMHCTQLSFEEFTKDPKALPRPIGLMAMNDLNAISLMTSCLDAGLRVPEEVAIVGADDTRIMCDAAEVPLTSVNCNFEEIGYRAAESLHLLMQGESQPETVKTIDPTGITVRKSTDTVAVPDPDAALALRMIRDHFRKPIGVSDIADQIGVSIRRLQSSFQEHLGFTMIQELTRVRVENAKQLLANKKLKLEAVALDSGFTSRFHLIRAFQRSTGTTPAAYRRSIAKNAG